MFYAIVIKRKYIITCVVLFIFMIVSLIGFNAGKQAVCSANIIEDGIPVPILMYHSVCINPKVSSLDYIISPDAFKEDMKYLKDNGYTSIFVSDLVNYVYNDAPLPEKPVIITLDDGFLNNLTIVVPILEEMDMKAVVSITGIYTENFSKDVDRNDAYAHLTWDDIKTLNESNRVEIGNHTYNMHEIGARRGCMKKKGESKEQYYRVLTKDLGKLQDTLTEKSNVTPSVFTYPYGFISKESIPIIKEMGFTSALTCNEQVNYINKDPEKLYNLGRFNRPSGISTSQFMKKIQIK